MATTCKTGSPLGVSFISVMEFSCNNKIGTYDFP